MPITRLLIANRGEIAIRIARSAAELGIATVAVHSADDAQSLHVRAADEARALQGSGPAAYLDAAQIVAMAREAGCDAIHPGYGFISENAAFARLCAEAGIAFVGPQPEVLDLFGDKAQARRFAAANGVDIVAGTDGPTTLEQAQAFLADLGPGGAIMVKALAGGGGRGMRPVTDAAQLPAAFERCRAEALGAFGNGDLYVERLFVHPRHVEVQVLGDGTGAVSHLWERECSVQRERQKIIEIAPAPFLRPAVRDRLLSAAVKLAAAAKYRGAGTFEFLVDAAVEGDGAGMRQPFGQQARQHRSRAMLLKLKPKALLCGVERRPLRSQGDWTLLGQEGLELPVAGAQARQSLQGHGAVAGVGAAAWGVRIGVGRGAV